MAEITFAGQKYYFTEEQVKLFRGRLVLEIFEQNYSTERKYSEFIFEYGEYVYTIPKFRGLTYDIVFNIVENGKDGLEGFYNENVKIKESEREIIFLGGRLSIIIDDEVKAAFKASAIDYFKKRFFPETEEDFEFLSEFIPPVVFCNLYEILINAEKQQENIEFVRNAIVYYMKKLNILERFGVDKFKFAQLELDLQIKFLALISIYKKPERINSLINFFNSDLLTKEELNNFIKKISDEFLEERIDEKSEIKNFILKSKVVGQIGINQTTNEVMFEIIKDKLLNLNAEDKNQFIDKLEKFANYDENLYAFVESLGDSVKFNTPELPEFEIFFKYSHSEMIKKIIYAYNFDSNFFEKDMTLVKFNEKIYENENLKNKILELQEQTKIKVFYLQVINIFKNIVNSNQWNSINSLEQKLWEKEKEILDNVRPKDRKIYIETFDKAKIILDKKIDIELITENLIEILLKGTESTKSLQQKEQIVLTNAQKNFDDIHNDKVEPGRREIYRKALAKAIDLAKEKIYIKDFINAFQKCISKRWWQHEKTATEKFKIVNDEYINFVKVYGGNKIAFKALTKAKRTELLKVENKLLNEEIDKFAMNNSQILKEIFDSVKKLEEKINSSNQAKNVKKCLLKKVNDIGQEKFYNISEIELLIQEIEEFKMDSEQTSEEIFDLSEKLWKDINSSSQPENVKNSLLKKVNDIGQEKFENIPPQQINSDFKFFPNH